MNMKLQDFGLDYEVYGMHDPIRRKDTSILKAAVAVGVSAYFLVMAMSIIQGLIMLYSVTH